MVNYDEISIHQVVILILVSRFWSVSTIVCPHYCRCFMNDGHRFVTCTNRALVSMDLGLPRTVEWLQLSSNSIFELKDNVFQEHGLEHVIILEMNNNHIESIGLDAFAGLKRLQVVDLSFNHLYYIIPNTFEMNLSLKQLYLGGNPLTYIQQSEPFLFSESLEVLDVSSCRLNYLTPALIVGLPSLRTLNVSHNSIQHVDELIEFMDHIKVIDISKTDIQCNEHAGRLSSWGSNHSASIIGYPCLSSKHIMSIEMTPEIPEEPVKPKWTHRGRLIDTSEAAGMDSSRSTEIEASESTELDSHEDNLDPSEKRPQGPDIQNQGANDQLESFNWIVWLAFINGFASGMAVAGSSIICWIYCARRRKLLTSRRRRHQTAHYCSVITATPTESLNLIDSPPPAYHELFQRT